MPQQGALSRAQDCKILLSSAKCISFHLQSCVIVLLFAFGGPVLAPQPCPPALQHASRLNCLITSLCSPAGQGMIPAFNLKGSGRLVLEVLGQIGP